MIVFISDLHFMDGTLECNNGRRPKKDPLAKAFRQVYKDLADMAKDAKADKVSIVFLGDIFDLIASSAWFKTSPKTRPWDTWGSPALTRGALDVMQGIKQCNTDVFAVISQDLANGFKGATERVFIPGNHDRLCRLPEMRPLVEACLGKLSPDSYQNSFCDPDHGVFARHGHEWDAYNFEGSAKFRHLKHVELPDSDYTAPAIGDLLTVEVAARLPDEVVANLPKSYSQAQKDALRKRVCRVFDVRPLPAIVPWLFQEVRNDSETVRDAVDKAVRKVASDIDGMPFVKAWMKKHDSILHPFDDASKLDYLMEICKLNGIKNLSTGLSVARKVMSWFPGDNYASKAVDDFARLDGRKGTKDRLIYVVYGHTHTPEQRAIEALPDGRDRVYLNTGTWRPVCEQGLTGRGFVSWHTLTYTVFYNSKESASSRKPNAGYPTFEVWTGGLKDID